MTQYWQEIAALMVVAVCAIYVVRRIWLTIRRPQATECIGCNSCGNSQPAAQPLVTLEITSRAATNR